MKKNNGGFTLVEVLVAMSLMFIVVICFTPFMLSSLGNIKLSGEERKTMYDDKADIEFKMATKKLDVDLENVGVYFSQDGLPAVVPSTAEGNYVRGKSDKLLGFVAKDTATLSLSPALINELSPNGAVISIGCDFIEINEPAKFQLSAWDATQNKFVKVNQTAYPYTFAQNGDDYKVKLTLNKTSFLRAGCPLLVSYGDGLSAEISVTPPSLVAVGADGTYYGRTPGADGKWVQGRGRLANGTYQQGKLGNETLNDVAWTGEQYAVGGNRGSWYYVSGETPWQYIEVCGSSLFGKVYNQIDDLFATELLDGVLMAFAHEEYAVWDTQLRSMQNASEMTGFSGSTGIAGEAITEAYFRSGSQFVAKPVCIYYFSNGIYMSTNPNSLSTYNSQRIPGISNVTCVASNKKANASSELVLCTGGPKILFAKPGEGEITSSSWKELPTTSGSVLTSQSQYYYIINALGPTPIGPFDEQLPIEAKGNKRNIIYNGVAYPIDSNGSASVRDIMMVASVEKYQGSNNGFLVAGNFSTAVYGPDLLVVGGNNISIFEKLTNNDAITVKGTEYYRYQGGNRFDKAENGNSANISIIKERFDGAVSTAKNTVGPLAYIENGTWYSATLPKSVPTDAVINKVEYIGGVYYAVGNSGFILSSSDGKTWINESTAGLTGNLRAISGWGIE